MIVELHCMVHTYFRSLQIFAQPTLSQEACFMIRTILNFSIAILLSGALFAGVTELRAAEKSPPHHRVAKTTADPEVPLDELELLLNPMTADQLWDESEGWFKLLQGAVLNLNQARLEVKRDNDVIKESGYKDDGKEQAVNQAELDTAEAAKDEDLERINQLREKRTQLVDRLSLVLNELNSKIGLTAEGKERDEILVYRNYMSAVGGIKVDVSDTRSTWKTIVSWANSKEGGRRWARHIGVFFASILGFWLIGVVLSKLVNRVLVYSSNTSVMLKNFIVKSVSRISIFIGFLMGLAALEIDIGPVLAIIGATGFVVAFALQSTLSNFASGLMILFYKPFDVDDFVDVSGATGKVKSMTLVTTTIMTSDNKLMVVPNNSIWGNVITNVTGSSLRRVDLVFGIGYDADIDKAEKILEDIMAENELVLKEPAPVVHLSELADSSVNFICRPWVKTADYWTVFWAITRQVKIRFDKEGISIPFPQRDVHIYNHGDNPESPQAE